MPRAANPTLRDDILKAALRLVEEKGVAAVTMREVAGALGYSATAIYQHFQSKEDLLLTLKLQAGDLLTEAMEQARSEPTLAEQLRAMGQAYVQFGLDNPTYYQLIFQDTESGISPTEEQMTRLRRSWTIMRDTLKAWMAELGVRGIDVDQEAHVLWAMGHGVTSLALAGRFPFADHTQIFALFDISAQRWGQGLIQEQRVQ
jgi:AcrR family transcriptional regulator